MYNSLHYRMILLHSICQVLHLYSLGCSKEEAEERAKKALRMVGMGEEYDKSGKLHSFLIQRNE